MSKSKKPKCKIDFMGLCAIVRPESDEWDQLPVVLPGTGYMTEHHPRLTFWIDPYDPNSAVEKPDTSFITVSAPNGREMGILDLRGQHLHIGKDQSDSDCEVKCGDAIPDLEQACGYGKLDADALSDHPKVKPVAGRVDLPPGKLKAKPGDKEWSFYPPRNCDCYSGRFASKVGFKFKLANGALTIRFGRFGKSPDRTLTLQPISDSVHLSISHLPSGSSGDPRHSRAYYSLLEQHIPWDERPYPVPRKDCTKEITEDELIILGLGEVGCNPFGGR